MKKRKRNKKEWQRKQGNIGEKETRNQDRPGVFFGATHDVERERIDAMR